MADILHRIGVEGATPEAPPGTLMSAESVLFCLVRGF